MNPTPGATAAVYRTGIEPAWIDYNGHLRDAYYGLVFSRAADAFMDRIGLDEDYRRRTANTLYTLEMHAHFLHEVKEDAILEVSVRLLGSDDKRIHAAFDMRREGRPQIVATAETMLLHVHQGDTPQAVPFPAEVLELIHAIPQAAAANAAADRADAPPGSRRMELRSRA